MHYDLSKHQPSIAKLTVFVIWSVGLLLGCLLFWSHSITYGVPVSALMKERLSVLGIFVVTLFPVIISALLHIVSQKIFLVYCFLKAFCFGFCFCFISSIFDGYPLHIRFLAQFSGVCMSVMLLIFWSRLILSSLKQFILEFFQLIFISIIVSLLDLLYITPFLNNSTITR